MQALKRRFKRSAEDEADDPDADIQRGMWKNHKLLPPALPAKVRYWDPLLLICSLYFFVTLPLILCFGLQPSIGWLVRARRRPLLRPSRRANQTHLPPQIFDYVLDALFWLDIFVSARTSFRHEDNEIEMNPKVIFLRYARRRRRRGRDLGRRWRRRAPHLRGDRPQARPPAVAVGRAQGRQVAVVEAVVEGGGGRGGGPRVHAQAGARPRRQGRLHRLEHVVGRRGVDGDVARVGLCVSVGEANK